MNDNIGYDRCISDEEFIKLVDTQHLLKDMTNVSIKKDLLRKMGYLEIWDNKIGSFIPLPRASPEVVYWNIQMIYHEIINQKEKKPQTVEQMSLFR